MQQEGERKRSEQENGGRHDAQGEIDDFIEHPATMDRLTNKIKTVHAATYMRDRQWTGKSLST